MITLRYGGTITNQIKRLGASCDWSRERFTLDEQLSRKTVFHPVKLQSVTTGVHISFDTLWPILGF